MCSAPFISCVSPVRAKRGHWANLDIVYLSSFTILQERSQDSKGLALFEPSYNPNPILTFG